MADGTWFDRQELQQIVSFIQDGGLSKNREKQIESLKEEQNRLREMQFGQNAESLSFDQNRSFKDFDVDEDSLLGVIVSLYKKVRNLI